MTLAVLAAVTGLVTVLVALYRDRSEYSDAPAIVLEWDPLPSVADVNRLELPLAVPGYEPAAVDTAMDTLARAYADLLAEAPSDVRARAYRRAAVRLGVDPSELPPHLGTTPLAGDPAPRPGDVVDPLEPLRAAAALATIDRRARLAARRQADGHAGRPEAAATEQP